jgi:hypothetical protein
MTLNLSEMKDEPLGKHPILEAWAVVPVCYGPTPDQTEQQVAAAADGEGVFKIDVGCLSVEALDHDARTAQFCSCFCICTVDADNV